MSTNDDILASLGVLAPLYKDAEIVEILVDAPDRVLIESDGKLVQADVHFDSPESLRQVIDDLLALGGVTLGPDETIGDMYLPDGAARALAVLPPTALHGPYLVIRKLYVHMITWEQIIQWGAISQEAYEFIYNALRVPANILVAGGAGSGKTTLLNRITEIIPEDQRVVIVENFPELQIRHPRSIFLEAGGPMKISMDDLLSTAAKMRPDWMVVGELFGSDAMRVMEIFSRGHSGMTTIHANSVEDALARLEALCLTANLGLGLGEIRFLITSALHLIMHQRKMPSGKRRVVQIMELCGVEDSRYLLQPLFRYNPETDRLEPTGMKPSWEVSETTEK